MKTYLGRIVVVSLLLGCMSIAAFAQSAPSGITLKGYIQNRLYASPEKTPRFCTFRVSLSATAKLEGDKTAYVEYYMQPQAGDQNYLESAYVDMPFANGSLRAGKGRMLNFGMVPNAGNRKTTEYNILSETFTQDRIQGVQYTAKYQSYDFGATAYTDLRVSPRTIGATPGVDSVALVQHFGDVDTYAGLSGRLAVAGKVGWSNANWKAHISGATGGLCGADAAALAKVYGYPAISTHNKYGVDVQYAKDTTVGSLEYYSGNFGIFGISGYSLMLGIEPKDSRKVYVRYSVLNNDLPAKVDYTKTTTWDTQQFIFGVVQPLTKGVQLEMDYVKNMESAPVGASELDNDVLVFELFSAF